ncbi:tumor necrosis factor receptor superfamily member 5-like [Ptychodera flava]|uniref:tumor necrosis factor receptor superfamily member 5-like n=1 Tax=Ptychodera flava TaxID=63121 RepID=UPI00396A164B
MSDLVVSENIPPLTTCITVTCLFTVIQAAPMKRDTTTCSPEDHRYPFNDMCCNMCQPGYKVHKHCTHTPDDGICVPCSEGYFMSEWNGATQCLPINLCNKSHEHISVHARPDGTSDNICACDPGFQYTASGELCIESPVKDSTQESEATLAPSFTLANSGSTLTSEVHKPKCHRLLQLQVPTYHMITSFQHSALALVLSF